MTKSDIYEENKVLRRTEKKFGKLKPIKVDKVYELEFNGRIYRNPDKIALLKDIETVENG